MKFGIVLLCPAYTSVQLIQAGSGVMFLGQNKINRITQEHNKLNFNDPIIYLKSTHSTMIKRALMVK